MDAHGYTAGEVGEIIAVLRTQLIQGMAALVDHGIHGVGQILLVVVGGDAHILIIEIGGVGGSRTESYVRAQQIGIGGNTIKDVQISCSENKQGAMADNRFDGLVGNALFAHFDIIFDFESWVIYLRPNNSVD